eukprot:364180-Chlamydomonas_euryale.AAC.7
MSHSSFPVSNKRFTATFKLISFSHASYAVRSYAASAEYVQLGSLSELLVVDAGSEDPSCKTCRALLLTQTP